MLNRQASAHRFLWQGFSVFPAHLFTHGQWDVLHLLPETSWFTGIHLSCFHGLHMEFGTSFLSVQVQVFYMSITEKRNTHQTFSLIFCLIFCLDMGMLMSVKNPKTGGSLEQNKENRLMVDCSCEQSWLCLEFHTSLVVTEEITNGQQSDNFAWLLFANWQGQNRIINC